jgi:hypothetical protein
VRRRAPKLLDWAPCLTAGAAAVLLALPGTRSFALTIQKENAPVEWATALLFMVAAAACAAAAARARGRERVLLALAAGVFLFVTGEELAWGQYLLGGPISEAWAQANRQGETTLHNLGPLQGLAEIWYFFAAVVAMLAMLPKPAAWLGGAAPARGLLPALLCVAGFSLCEILATLLHERPWWEKIHAGIRPLKEYIELVISWISARYGVACLRGQRSAGTSCVTVAPSRTSIGSER